MKNFRELLGQAEFHVFLFCLGLVLLNWPFLAIFHSGGLERAFTGLFTLWGIAVALLFLVGRHCNDASPNGDTRNGDTRNGKSSDD